MKGNGRYRILSRYTLSREGLTSFVADFIRCEKIRKDKLKMMQRDVIISGVVI
jgi:hypothetical protein